jgi:hypothetical protein
MTSIRTIEYAISAVAWFFLFPQPCVALTGAMLSRTLAPRPLPGNPPQTASCYPASRCC